MNNQEFLDRDDSVSDDMSLFPIIKNETNIDTNEIIDLLKTVYDPEIYYSIYDLGLIYGITIEKDKIHILMTLTSANCPEAQTLPANVQDTIFKEFPNHEVTVEITFEPSWTVDNMTDEVKLGLGLL